MAGPRTTKSKRSTKKAGAKKRAPSGPKASWRGMLRFGLVTIPVQAINAHIPKERVAFHQLHATCHSRIHYAKMCPIHGEISNDEIVSGFEYKKGHYIEVEPEELDKLKTKKERALSIDSFISPDELDPIYFDGRMYYLAPDGADAAKSYTVLLRAMERQERWGVGQVIFSGRQQVVVVRPGDGALQMAMLSFAEEMRKPSQAVPSLPVISNADKTVSMAEELIENWTDEHFNFGHYVDRYEEDVKKLIEARAHGHEVVAPEEDEEPPVYNLMEALRKSMAKGKDGKQNGHPHSRGSSRRPAHRKRRA